MNFIESDLNLIFKALAFSAEKHRDQRRKDLRETPYINHPIQVAEYLWSAGGVRDVTTLAAAVLHDTIEDTDTTPEEIETEFGSEVRSLVLELTDDKNLPKKERKRLQIENAAKKTSRAKQIKIADKTCNINDIIASQPKGWTLRRRKEYLDWAEEVIEGLRGDNPILESRFDSALEEGRKKLSAEPPE